MNAQSVLKESFEVSTYGFPNLESNGFYGHTVTHHIPGEKPLFLLLVYDCCCSWPVEAATLPVKSPKTAEVSGLSLSGLS